MLANRLKKNHKRLKKALKSYRTNAWRLYHQDIPEYPYYIDLYADTAIVYERGKQKVDDDLSLRKKQEIKNALQEVLQIRENDIIFKKRIKQKGKKQYFSLQSSQQPLVVQEGQANFLIRPDSYLDCGLFLDHRNLRHHIFQIAKGKNILNLFCYTGSFSIQALLGGAQHCVNIDMSSQYLDWLNQNAKLNSIPSKKMTTINTDILQWLKKKTSHHLFFDLIILDPPSFSNSKKMQTSFDVQRDHSELIHQVILLLKRDGILFFSTNKQKFILNQELSEQYAVKDITHLSLPPDFTRSAIHRCYSIQHRSNHGTA